jgi:hypothetical protein
MLACHLTRLLPRAELVAGFFHWKSFMFANNFPSISVRLRAPVFYFHSKMILGREFVHLIKLPQEYSGFPEVAVISSFTLCAHRAPRSFVVPNTPCASCGVRRGRRASSARKIDSFSYDNCAKLLNLKLCRFMRLLAHRVLLRAGTTRCSRRLSLVQLKADEERHRLRPGQLCRPSRSLMRNRLAAK